MAKIRSARTKLDSLASANGEIADMKTVKAKLTEIENALIQTQEGKVGAQLKPKLQSQLTSVAWPRVQTSGPARCLSAVGRY